MIANDRPVPPALMVVAMLFLLSGLIATAGAVATFFGPFIHIDANILGVPICFGLCRYSRGWRICALVMIWAAMLMLPFGFIDSVLARSFGGNILGWNINEVSGILFTLICSVCFLAAFWQYRVLTRLDIRGLFYPVPEPAVITENP